MTSPIAPDHVYQIVSVSDPALSGDGSKLAFVRSRVDSDRATTRSQIVMMDMETGVEADFTSGPKDGSPPLLARRRDTRLQETRRRGPQPDMANPHLRGRG